jgi:uncharacterized membrane protein YgcG
MLRRFGPALLVTLLVCSLGERARALPQDTSPVVVNADIPIPSNGSLLIQGSEAVPVVRVTASDGRVMFGTVLPRGPVFWMIWQYWAWVPDEPLPLGDYEVSFENSTEPSSQTITVGEPWVPSLPSVTFDLMPTGPSTSPMIVTCDDADPSDLITPRPFMVEVNIVSVVTEAIFADASPEHLGQLLFGMRPIAPEQISSFTLRPLADSTLSAHFFSEQDEYCVEIDAMDINTGVITTYETQHCVAGSELEITIPLGFQYDGMDLRELMLPGCPSPPMFTEPMWCRVNQDACAEPTAPESCSICPPLVVAPPDAGSAGTGAEAGTSGGTGGASGGTGGASGGAGGAGGSTASDAGQAPGSPTAGEAGADAEPSAKHVQACGCRIAGARTTSDAALQLGVLLIVLYLRLVCRHRGR